VSQAPIPTLVSAIAQGRKDLTRCLGSAFSQRVCEIALESAHQAVLAWIDIQMAAKREHPRSVENAARAIKRGWREMEERLLAASKVSHIAALSTALEIMRELQGDLVLMNHLEREIGEAQEGVK
jgi:hypothetical protein